MQLTIYEHQIKSHRKSLWSEQVRIKKPYKITPPYREEASVINLHMIKRVMQRIVRTSK